MGIQAVQPLLVYTTPTGPIAAPAQAEIIALINVLKAAIPDQGPGEAAAQSSPSPDWDQMQPRMASQLRAEMDAMIVAVDATPEA